MFEMNVAKGNVRIGDFVRVNYFGEIRDVMVTGWRHQKDKGLAQLQLTSGAQEYTPEQLFPGAKLMRGVLVAKVWRWSEKPVTAKKTTKRPVAKKAVKKSEPAD